MVKLVKEHAMDTIEMRKAYCDSLISVAKEDSRIVLIDCDLSSSMGTKDFYKAFPNRSFNVGIEESNGCGVAAGMSATGLIPFFHSFAVFTSRRIYDQIFVSCAYASLNVKLIGGDAGVSATYNGGTHMAFEDFGALRCIPNITLIEPSDAVMMKDIIPQIAKHYGVDYIRMPRKQVPRIYEEGSEFTIGKAVLVREGTDVSIIASGMTVYESIKAAEALAVEGISARVIDMFTIKPIDKDCIIECAKKTGAIITVENHNIINSLGSAVSEVLVENAPVPMERVGVQDEFGEVGQQSYLMERFGLTAKTICEKAKLAISRKR
ncbi:MAG: transketolase family protein [Bacillota bacterium]